MNDQNFVKLALENGGSIHPLLVPSSYLLGPAVTNPSIYNDNGKRQWKGFVNTVVEN